MVYKNPNALSGYADLNDIFLFYLQFEDPYTSGVKFDTILVTRVLTKDVENYIGEFLYVDELADNTILLTDSNDDLDDWTIEDNYWIDINVRQGELQYFHEEYSDDDVLTYEFISLQREIGDSDDRDPEFDLDAKYTGYMGIKTFPDRL